MMEGTTVSSDVIIEEVLKRKAILLDLNESRNPEANRRKLKAWKEIQDIVLVQCKKVLTIEQVKRIWCNRKAHVREAILKEKRYRNSTGGGLFSALEKTISTTLSSLSQAETLLARTLGREAVMAGLGNMETYVDKIKGGGYGKEMQGEWEGGELESNPHKRQSQRYCENGNFGDDMMGCDQWRVEARGDAGGKEGRDRVGRNMGHDLRKRKDTQKVRQPESSGSDFYPSDIEGSEGRRVGGRDNAGRKEEKEGWEEGNPSSPEVMTEAELRAIRLRRVQEQLNDFDSDVSSISPPKRRKYTDREVNRFQMEVLKEERALVAKKSLILDRQLELLGDIKEMVSETLQILRGNKEVKKPTKQIEPWDPSDGDPNVAESVESIDL